MVAELLLLVPCLMRGTVASGVELGRAFTIATASVANKWFEPYMSEHVCLEAVRASTGMRAPRPGALKFETGRSFPGRSRRTSGDKDPELPNVVGAGRQLERLVEHRAAKYVPSLESLG